MESIHVATRKGLLHWQRQGKAWRLQRHDFPGDPVTLLLRDPRDGTQYAALDLGHFGPKMHALRPGEEKWEEIVCPAMPADVGEDIAVKVVWALAAGGADERNTL